MTETQEQTAPQNVSFSEALRNPELYNLSQEDIARIKRLQFAFRGYELPTASSKIKDWKSFFLLNKSKEPIGHLSNINLVLSNDEDWWDEEEKPLLAWDTMRNQIAFRVMPPWSMAYAGEQFKYWSDEDADRLVTWLGLKYQIKVTSDVAFKAARLVAQANRFHPIQEMLQKLPDWDQTPRLSSWLSAYLGATTKAASSKYLSDVGTWSMVSLVARVMEPGCKVDTMLILEGLQGKGKSMLLEILAGAPEYLLVLSGVELGSKESLELLRGKWVVEMSELDSLNRSEANAAKAFVSRGYDTYRAAYGRESKDYVRQCVFFGTTNRAIYLQDETGARRYWPILCTLLDLKGFQKIRDQLLAEALYLYRGMYTRTIPKQWWAITDEELERCEQEQEARRVADPWEETIALYVTKESLQQVTISQLLTDALKIPEGRQSRSDCTRVGLILQRLDWKIGGRLQRTGPRFYIAPPLEQKLKVGSGLDHTTPWDSSE